MRDDELVVDPATIGISMTPAQADAFNADEARKFAATATDYYPCPENLDIIGSYLSRNGVNIVNSITLQNVVNRLNSVGLLKTRPAPSPVAPPAAIDSPLAEPVAAKTEPNTYPGFDRATGQPCTYTAFQVSQMDAATFRKLCMRKSDTVLPFRALY